MVDSPSFESAPRPKTPDVKSGAFPILESRLADIPDTTENFTQIQSMLSALPVSPERTSIERNLLSVDEDMLDADIILLLKRAKEDILKLQIAKEKTETKVEKTETKVEKTETKVEKTQTVEVDNESIREQRKLATAQKRITALYKSFGGEEIFKERNKDLNTWQDAARKELLSQDPKLATDPALETKALLLALQTNQTQINKNAEGIPGYNSKILFRDIESSLADLRVPFTPSKIPAGDMPNTSTEIIGYKAGDKLTRTGYEYRSSDGQIIDVSTYPPTRTIESTDGIRITQPNTDKKKDYYDQADKYQRDYNSTQSEIRSIKKDVDSELGTLRQYAERLHLGSIDKLDESSYDQILHALGKELQGAEKGTPEYEDIDRLGQKIAERKQKYIEPGGLRERQERLRELTTKLTSIDQAKKLQKELYLESLKTETESSRSNLEYLESTHLTSLLGDSGTKLLIDQINQTTPDKFSSLALETQWGPREKELFASGLKKLLSLDARNTHEFFEPDGYTMKRYAPDQTPIDIHLKQRLEKNGVYGGIPPAVIRERLIAVMNSEGKSGGERGETEPETK